MYMKFSQLRHVVEKTSGQRFQSSFRKLKLPMSICTRRENERRRYMKRAECSQLRDLIGQGSQTLVAARLQEDSQIALLQHKGNAHQKPRQLLELPN